MWLDNNLSGKTKRDADCIAAALDALCSGASDVGDLTGGRLVTTLEPHIRKLNDEALLKRRGLATLEAKVNQLAQTVQEGRLLRLDTIAEEYRPLSEAINRLISGNLAQQAAVVNALNAHAAGDVSESEIATLPADDSGLRDAVTAVGLGLRQMRSEREQMLADRGEQVRIKIAVESVTTNVVIADEQDIIRYVNPALKVMFRDAERDIQKDLPHFRVETLLGSKIDIFHKEPQRISSMVANLRATHRAELKLGGRTLNFIANPIFDADGTRLGTVVEWLDRTREVAAQKETAEIVEAAARGDFTRRLPVEGREGFFKQLAEHVNKLMETSEAGLNDVVRVLSALSKGDLTVTMSGDYQGTFGRLKDDANGTVSSLGSLIVQIRKAVEQVNSAAGEILAGNTDLSQRTEEQASSLEETASSMEQLTQTVKQTTGNARKANDLAIGASSIAVKGGTVVREVVTMMDAINGASKKIVDIISVIDGIAFQTNILALNAAVEAARAGEQGRGFAVVAGEVRSLAQRSASAAKEIKDLINDSVEKTNAGGKLVDQAGTTMDEIVAAVKNVTDIMAQISAASTEQGSGIEQVNQAISQMDNVTQQNAALVEEAAAAAGSLEEQAQQLVRSVSTFKLGDSMTFATSDSPSDLRPKARESQVTGTAHPSVTRKPRIPFGEQHARPLKPHVISNGNGSTMTIEKDPPPGDRWEKF